MSATGPIPPPTTGPPRWCADLPLPPSRYVPGRGPHPFRDPGGHLYCGGGPPPEQPWDPELPWRQDRRWLYAGDLFDHRYFWEAHEAWEALWHQVPRGSPHAHLLQGLIQVAAAALKGHMGQHAGAERLRMRALAHLAAAGEEGKGLDLGALRMRVEEMGPGAPWPRLPWVDPPVLG